MRTGPFRVKDDSELIVGAVAYTANVVPIWEGMRNYFAATDTPIDFVLYSNYERQVSSLINGHIDIAWNTNVAWIRTLRQTNGQARPLAMRDTDLKFQTIFISRAGTQLKGLDSLRNKRLALGSRDSGQARILPIFFLEREGIKPGDVELIIFDSDVGKHGDTGRSDLDALRAVLGGQAEAAAIGVNTWEALRAGGEEGLNDVQVVWESEFYNHCNFTTVPSLSEHRSSRWVDNLLNMSWENPDHRRILEMEGLREWRRPELDGYGSLMSAMDHQGLLDGW